MEMTEPVSSSIEKIKLQEQNEANKLKEKREFDATIASMNREIRDALLHIEKSKQEQDKLIKENDSLQRIEMLENIRRDTLSAQLVALKIELNELLAKSNEGVTNLWKLRSSFCNDVHKAAESYDVWALLMKPIEMPQNAKKSHNCNPLDKNTKRLQAALETRAKALVERDCLKREPDHGEQFNRCFFRYNTFRRFLSTEIKENEPIKFSTSDAAKRKVSIFRNKRAETMPWYQPYCVVGSVAVFLIYFCILREENDVDKEFTKTLYDRIKGLEKEQLLQTYKYNKEHGNSVQEIETRLREIEAEEAKLSA